MNKYTLINRCGHPTQVEKRRECSGQMQHFVLVHGAGHGAWTWYKLKPLLEAAGHRVTALDMAACGNDPTPIHGVTSLEAYTAPLLEFMGTVPPGNKVILVGHSFGGFSLALAMDRFPDKISVAVFLTAIVPGIGRPLPSEKTKEFFVEDEWMDSLFLPSTQSEEPLTLVVLDPKFLQARLYHQCTDEDISLASLMMRPWPRFAEDPSKLDPFSKDGFGSVEKAYIACGQDRVLAEGFQRWMIDNSGIQDVMEIRDSDHMPMLCRPREVCGCLLQVADKYP